MPQRAWRGHRRSAKVLLMWRLEEGRFSLRSPGLLPDTLLFLSTTHEAGHFAASLSAFCSHPHLACGTPWLTHLAGWKSRIYDWATAWIPLLAALLRSSRGRRSPRNLLASRTCWRRDEAQRKASFPRARPRSKTSYPLTRFPEGSFGLNLLKKLIEWMKKDIIWVGGCAVCSI